MRLKLTARDRRSRPASRHVGPMPPTPRAADAQPRCPSCGKPVIWQGNAASPFCAVTCKLLDLGGWLDEAYRVPGLALSHETPDPEPPRDASGERG